MKKWIAIVAGVLLLAWGYTFWRAHQISSDTQLEMERKVVHDSAAAFALQQDSVRKANQARADSITALQRASDSLGLVAERVTNYARALEHRLPPPPALADSNNPAWMHRAISETERADSLDRAVTALASQHIKDSQAFATLYVSYKSDSLSLVNANKIIASSLHVADKEAAARDCKIGWVLTCPNRVQGAILGVTAGVVLDHILLARK